jgi:hypothetical protein
VKHTASSRGDSVGSSSGFVRRKRRDCLVMIKRQIVFAPRQLKFARSFPLVLVSRRAHCGQVRCICGSLMSNDLADDDCQGLQE